MRRLPSYGCCVRARRMKRATLPIASKRLRRGGEFATVAGTFLAYGAIFFDRLAPLYLVATIAGDLGMPSAYEGTLALVIGLGWAAAMPIVRAISGRFDERNRIVLAAVITAAFGLISAAAGSWVIFVALRGIAGVASATGSPAATALVFSVAPPQRRGLDLGVMQSATRVIGSLVAPVVATAVAVAHGWRTAIVVSALLLLSGALVLLFAVPDRERSSRHSHAGPTSVAFHLRPGGRRNLVLSTVGCVMLLAWLTVWSQSSVQLIQGWLQVDADAAGRYVSWFGLGAAVAAVLLPPLSDRIGRPGALALAGAFGGIGGIATGLTAAAGVVPPPAIVPVFLLFGGAAMGGLPLVISIIPAEAVATGDVGRALMGPIAGGEVLGAALLPGLAAVAAVPLGRGLVVALTAAGVLGLIAVAAALRPLAPERH